MESIGKQGLGISVYDETRRETLKLDASDVKYLLEHGLRPFQENVNDALSQTKSEFAKLVAAEARTTIRQLLSISGDRKYADGGISSAAIDFVTKELAPFIDDVIAAYREGDEDIRFQAVVAIFRINASKTVSVLIDALHDADSDIRGGAAQALGQLGDKAGLVPLARLLQVEKNQEVLDRIHWALEQKISNLTVEAETLEDARKQLRLQVPENLRVISEEVLSDGLLHAITGTAETVEAAFSKAQNQVPTEARVVNKRLVSGPSSRVVAVAAFDGEGAKIEMERRIAADESVQEVKMISSGKEGFFGLGRKPNQYEAEVITPAICEITYRSRASISAKIGEK